MLDCKIRYFGRKIYIHCMFYEYKLKNKIITKEFVFISVGEIFGSCCCRRKEQQLCT